MTRALRLALVLAALPLLAGYAGSWHPAGDSFAVFRLQGAGLLAVLAAAALWAGARRAGLAGLALSAMAAGPILWAMALPPQPGQDLRLYQKNMLFRNDDLAGLEADIRAAAPDIVTLQEVSDPNRALMAALADILPHQAFCPFAAVGGTAVLTRLPPLAGAPVCDKGLTALRVTGPKGPMWLVSIHLHWPWPYGQKAQVEALLPHLEAMEDPVVMAGDFNMVRGSAALAAFRWAGGVTHAGPMRGTYIGFAPWLRLPIDHVLAPGGGRMELRPALGSDHLGLLADLSLTER